MDADDRLGAVAGEFRDVRFPDRFEVLRVVGRGGTGAVFAALDRRLQRKVALKVLHVGMTDEAELAQHEEGRVLASLTHPHLVTVFDTFLTLSQRRQPTAFLVLEYVDGPDLHQYLRTAQLSAQQVARIGVQLCSALAYVHERGFLHQDVKPSNVLLAFDGDGVTAKLSDFGTAVAMRGTVRQGEFTIGTAAYLSPEQAEGTDLTAASDVYALGLVLLEAATGDVAFTGSVVEAALARLEEDPVVPDTLPPELRHVLAGMTRRRPSERMDLQSAGQQLLQLQHRLESTAGRHQGDVAPTPTTEAAPVRSGPVTEGTAQFFRPQEAELTRLLELALLMFDGDGAALLEEDEEQIRHRTAVNLPEVATSPLWGAIATPTGEDLEVHLAGGVRFLVARMPVDTVRRHVVVRLSDGASITGQMFRLARGFVQVVESALQLRDSFRRALFAR